MARALNRVTGWIRDMEQNPRAVALAVLARIDEKGAYANLVLSHELGRSSLERRDRALVTALVDGTTRMRRSCDFLIDRFVKGEIEPAVRRALRLGAFQMTYMDTPSHAAVSTAVDVTPRRARGLVNAVLRRVSENPISPDAGVGPDRWPNAATWLSYPDWIVQRLTNDLGEDVAITSLQAMNNPAPAQRRDDGYVQDVASRCVVDAVAATPGSRVFDVCAAPGGKATALAELGAYVVAGDRSLNRASLIASNSNMVGQDGHVGVLVSDGCAAPFRPASFDSVLVDAPCSGLGSLRRRADARWRITSDSVDRLGTLQQRLLVSVADLVQPGGRLVYSVCTLTTRETVAVHDYFRASHPHFVPEPMNDPWEAFEEHGGRLLPTSDGRDGMTCFRFVRH